MFQLGQLFIKISCFIEIFKSCVISLPIVIPQFSLSLTHIRTHGKTRIRPKDQKKQETLLITGTCSTLNFMLRSSESKIIQRFLYSKQATNWLQYLKVLKEKFWFSSLLIQLHSTTSRFMPLHFTQIEACAKNLIGVFSGLLSAFWSSFNFSTNWSIRQKNWLWVKKPATDNICSQLSKFCNRFYKQTLYPFWGNRLHENSITSRSQAKRAYSQTFLFSPKFSESKKLSFVNHNLANSPDFRAFIFKFSCVHITFVSLCHYRSVKNFYASFVPLEVCMFFRAFLSWLLSIFINFECTVYTKFFHFSKQCNFEPTNPHPFFFGFFYMISSGSSTWVRSFIWAGIARLRFGR